MQQTYWTGRRGGLKEAHACIALATINTSARVHLRSWHLCRKSRACSSNFPHTNVDNGWAIQCSVVSVCGSELPAELSAISTSHPPHPPLLAQDCALVWSALIENWSGRDCAELLVEPPTFSIWLSCKLHPKDLLGLIVGSFLRLELGVDGILQSLPSPHLGLLSILGSLDALSGLVRMGRLLFELLGQRFGKIVYLRP